MRSTSKCKIKHLTDHKLPHVFSLSHTPCKQVFVFAITSSTLLHAAWLLHSSQIEQSPFVHDNYYPTPSLLASIMTCATTKALKDSSTFDSAASKHKMTTGKNRGGNTASSPSSKKLTGEALAQTVAIVSPFVKTINPLTSPLPTDEVVNPASVNPDKLLKEDEVDPSTNTNSLKPKEEITVSGKDTDMGVSVSEDGDPASATKLASTKGVDAELTRGSSSGGTLTVRVEFAGVVEMIQDKEGKSVDNHLVNNNTACNSGLSPSNISVIPENHPCLDNQSTQTSVVSIYGYPWCNLEKNQIIQRCWWHPECH